MEFLLDTKNTRIQYAMKALSITEDDLKIK